MTVHGKMLGGGANMKGEVGFFLPELLGGT